MNRVKVGFYGTGTRMIERYLPVCAQLSDKLNMVCIGGRTKEKVQALGERYELPWYTDIDKMLSEHKVDMVCNIVSCVANYETTAKIAPHGAGVILETPIELDLTKAHALFDLIKEHKINIEVAENGFRVPQERIVRKLLDTGMFGKVLIAYNDLVTHGYHGMNLLRNYVGFDVEPVSVTAFHESLTDDGNERSVGMRLGFIHFENKAIGMHSMAYGLPANPWPVHKHFVAENGWLSMKEGMVLEGKKERKVKIKRIDHTVGKTKTCLKMEAKISGRPDIVWENPFADKPFNDDEISVAAAVMSMARAVSEQVPQEYSLKDALRDYEIDSAMCSSHVKGKRVAMPLDLATVADERARGLY